ncbi:MAG: NADPH dehydrogenase NamA [Acholeplasmataceae bacterium]
MKLFKEIKIKDMKLKNRIVMPPMCMYSAVDGFANDFHVIHYATRAVGQIGLITVEATAVLPNGGITKDDLGIWSDDHIKSLSWIVNRVHHFGSKIGIQLSHAGRKARDANPKIAPSSIPYGDLPSPIEMSIAQIKEVVEAFKAGARRANQAGFDYLEIHAAHGYLINEFLSPLSNKRSDSYGGSLEGRIRLLNEIIIAIRNEWPIEKPLGIRISASEYHQDGLKPKDLVEILNQITPGVVDIINVSSGGIIDLKPDSYPGYQLGFAKKIKAETPFFVMGGGLINDARMASDALEDNEADLIYFGRLALRDPYFPLKFAQRLGVEIEWPRQYVRAKTNV